jgi:hypothetical protein
MEKDLPQALFQPEPGSKISTGIGRRRPLKSVAGTIDPRLDEG